MPIVGDAYIHLTPVLFEGLTVDHANFLPPLTFDRSYFASKGVSIFELQPESASLYQCMSGNKRSVQVRSELQHSNLVRSAER